MNPLVTAVIPTHNRPDLVQRAIRSALNQTYANLEVIVVVDGPEPETVKLLEALREPRLRVIELQENVRCSEARNTGVRAARGEWIASLDDDDEWMPEKIARQVEVAARADPSTNFICCRYELRNNSTIIMRPRRFPHAGEDWSEFVYVHGEDLLPGSQALIQRSLLLRVPFTKGLPSNEDVDWLLRAREANAIVPEWMEEVLMVYHNESNVARLSKGSDWEFPYRWALEHRKTLLTPKAFSYCLVRISMCHIRQSQKPLRNSLLLLHKAISLGRIDLRFCVFYLQYLCRFVLLDDNSKQKVKLFIRKMKPLVLQKDRR